MKIKKCAL